MTATATLRARVELWTWRHGWWLPLCLVLCAAAAVLAWDARSSTLQLRALASTLPVAAAPVAPPARNTAAEDAQRVAALRELLLPSHEATASVRRLVGLTQPELAWQRAEFQHSDDAAPGVARLQITVPVSGEYRAMRRALQRALAEMPQLSLDQLQLRREQAGESQLETRLRFSLWLRTKAKGSK